MRASLGSETLPSGMAVACRGCMRGNSPGSGVEHSFRLDLETWKGIPASRGTAAEPGQETHTGWETHGPGDGLADVLWGGDDAQRNTKIRQPKWKGGRRGRTMIGKNQHGVVGGEVKRAGS